MRQGAAGIQIAAGLTVQEHAEGLPYDAIQKVPRSLRAAILAGTSNADLIVMMQAAIDAAITAGYRSIYFCRGLWCQSDLLDSKGLRLIGEPGGTVFKALNAIPRNETLDAVHQGQTVWLHGNSYVYGITLDGGGIGAGFVALNEDEIVIDTTRVQNGPLAQAYQLQGLGFLRLSRVSAYRVQYCTQMWACNRVILDSCFFDRSVAGLFIAGTSNIVATGCVVSNMEDVGLDMEGGASVLFSNCVVSSCKNGEISIFPDLSGANIGNIRHSFKDCVVHRTATYIKRDGTVEAVDTAQGAVWINGISAGAKAVVFDGLHVHVDANAGMLWRIDDWGTTSIQDVTICNSTFRFDGTGKPFEITVRASGFKYFNNYHQLTAAVGTSGIFKNMIGGVIRGNTFKCDVLPTVPLVLLYTDLASQQVCYVNDNDFIGYGQYACKIDQFTSGAWSYSIGGNRFSQKPEIDGGLQVTANGVPIYDGQCLLVAETGSTGGSVTIDFDTLQWVGSDKAKRPFISFEHVIALSGNFNNSYSCRYASNNTAGKTKSYDGTGSGSGVLGSATEYASFPADSTMVVTRGAATNHSYTKLYLQSAA